MEKEFDIFIAPDFFEDEAWTRKLIKALKDQGLRVWHDAVEVKAGELWEERVRHGLQSSRNVVFVLGPNAAQSNWVAVVMGAAIGLGKAMIPVVSADLRARDIPEPMRKYRLIPKTDPAATAEEIAEAVSLKDVKPKSPHEPEASVMSTADVWDDAQQIASLLRQGSSGLDPVVRLQIPLSALLSALDTLNRDELAILQKHVQQRLAA